MRFRLLISTMLIFASLTAAGQIISRQDITTANLPDDNGLTSALPFLLPLQNIGCQQFPSLVSFKLYSKETDTIAVWQETQTVVTNGGSYVHTALLGLTTSGLPMDVFSSSTAMWLGVQCEGEAEQARLMMSSVPYALKSLDASNLGGRPASDYALASATSSTSSTVNLNNEISRAQLAEGNLALDISSEALARQTAISDLLNSIPATTMRTDQPSSFTSNTQYDGAAIVVHAMLSPFAGSGWDALLAVTDHPMGNGLEGHATSSSGEGWGVYGQSDSAHGSGVVGEANDNTGSAVTFGIQGLAHSSQGIGVFGFSDGHEGDGARIGVMGKVSHSSAVAGVFDNSTEGLVLSGRKDGIETFSVNSAGVVRAAAFEGDGSKLTGITSQSDIIALKKVISLLQSQVARLEAKLDAITAAPDAESSAVVTHAPTGRLTPKIVASPRSRSTER